MRRIRKNRGWVVPAIAGIGLLLGCSSSLDVGDNETADYILWVTLERNLDANTDVIAIQFTTKDGDPTEGQVIIEGYVVSNFDAEGKATILRQPPQEPMWSPGDLIHVIVLDTSGSAILSDSLVMPGTFTIYNVDPFNEPWRAGQPNPRFEWETSASAVNYVVSVQARTRAEARGYAEYHETQSGLSATLTPDVFYDEYDNLIDDYYDIHVIAYNPNFIPWGDPPDDPSYGVPEFPEMQIPSPIISDKVSGGLSALLVCEHETIEVAQ